MHENIFCPCCGYDTLSAPAHTYGICPICLWEDDPLQYEDVDILGANQVTLRIGQNNFVVFGACEEIKKKLTIKPDRTFRRKKNWRIL